MNEKRIKSHPILSIPQKDTITFYWNGKPLAAQRGEMIASALIANGINVFGHHHKDNTAQGIFCANGQCAKCTVIANTIPVKSCMVEVKENMFVNPAEGLPELPDNTGKPTLKDSEEIATDVLIIGGGPAGLSAAIQLGKYNIPAILIDDKNALGGKLVLQTHKFFGSQEDSYAGIRGIDIGQNLAREVNELASVKVWLNSTALFVFSDKKTGILKDGVYKIVSPKLVLNAAGAREKFLRFSGNTLAGIYGAGAFQTLVNRDLVKSSQRLFIIGGGNVGLIAGYHALQAGIEVVGLVEAMAHCGGYKVHADKLKRLGVSIYTSHTILSANGNETVESITIAQIDEHFKPIQGTEKTFLCDTILVAVGLDPLAEFTEEAQEAGLPVFAAGDALEIAEASSAMFNGKIAGLLVAKEMGASVDEIPQEWYDKADVLKSHPGKILKYQFTDMEEGIFPLIHCIQEIPCNPCTTVCPTDSIFIKDDTLMGLPYYEGSCIGCGKCVLICPGLAITLIDYRKDKDFPIVTIPYELSCHYLKTGQNVPVVDIEGHLLDEVEIVAIDFRKSQKTALVKVKAPKKWAKKIVSFQVQDSSVSLPLKQAIIPELHDKEAMICLCERVTVSEVEQIIEQGITDLNQIKAITRAGMGPCGAKTCEVLIKQVLRQKGLEAEKVVPNTRRPVFVEAFLETFADGGEESENV